jgi:hypothetical protein
MVPRWRSRKAGTAFVGQATSIPTSLFNLFNHPNFGFPDTASSDSTFGQIFNLEQPPTTIVGSGIGGDAAPRMIQLKAQLQF